MLFTIKLCEVSKIVRCFHLFKNQIFMCTYTLTKKKITCTKKKNKNIFGYGYFKRNKK